MKKTKFNWQNYWNPTPKKVRQLADSLLVSCVALGIVFQNNDLGGWGMAFEIIGVALKLVSNMFTEK
jgi:hypothetical protein